MDVEALKEALEDAERRRARLLTQLEDLQAQIGEAERECEGLRLAVARHDGAAVMTPDPVATMKRSDAVEYILQNAKSANVAQGDRGGAPESWARR